MYCKLFNIATCTLTVRLLSSSFHSRRSDHCLSSFSVNLIIRSRLSLRYYLLRLCLMSCNILHQYHCNNMHRIIPTTNAPALQRTHQQLVRYSSPYCHFTHLLTQSPMVAFASTITVTFVTFVCHPEEDNVGKKRQRSS